jgi:hypothetical protein
MFKSRTMKLAGHIACMGGNEECIRDFVEKGRKKKATRKI